MFCLRATLFEALQGALKPTVTIRLVPGGYTGGSTCTEALTQPMRLNTFSPGAVWDAIHSMHWIEYLASAQFAVLVPMQAPCLAQRTVDDVPRAKANGDQVNHHV